MVEYKKHLIPSTFSILMALKRINELGSFSILTLFVTDEGGRLMGSLTDGDIRRGLIKGLSLEENVMKIMNPKCKFIEAGKQDFTEIQKFRENMFKMIPVVDGSRKIIDLLNFDDTRNLLPLDAVIMAGGRGVRLSPLTDNIPKPLLKVGNKPILEYNLSRLATFGIKNIHISINYLGEQIKAYFQDGHRLKLNIEYIEETKPLGTIGSIKMVRHFKHDYLLIINSDILTNIDYEDFLMTFLESGSDMMLAAVPYTVKLPYAIIETDGEKVQSFREKPEYNYYSNTGIYLMKKELLEYIPENTFFDATDLMDIILKNHKVLKYYPMVSYWLDIGKPDDYKKAQEDIRHIKF